MSKDNLIEKLQSEIKDLKFKNYYLEKCVTIGDSTIETLNKMNARLSENAGIPYTFSNKLSIAK